ncbi:translation initiation factor IF-2 N-terminal domain-containing protein [Lentzea sp. HUAS12]|uniref:translation initiation factor IF-2 N-terminal domain-containing protein n=1 Tax=Lentzea sp. HUAS12 TaxID=2951806 RepID=UPI00209EC579|nr:translation initiation factor IF-2 N-terminal domain-containing protein [Lentzea sp. HUAS12]USX48565.1 translation initiation factor IF-2 N-terminal domain-containing protein [Lentzea sp. HUAS12]
MSNKEQPAGGTGGQGVVAARPELADLPDKLRVHALAKLLSVSSKDVMTALADLGEVARSAQSSVSRDVALKVAETLVEWDDVVTGEVTEDYEAPAIPAFEAPALAPVFAAPSAVFLPPTPVERPKAPVSPFVVEEEPVAEEKSVGEIAADELDAAEAEQDADADADVDGDDEGDSRRRRRRGRRGRGRGKGTDAETGEETDEAQAEESSESTESDDAAEAEDEGDESSTRRRRRRRRRKTGADDEVTSEDDPPNTVVHVRESRDARDDKADSEAAQSEVRSIRGSTRLEAKRQRRRDGREAGRRRAPVLTEAEFLARREAVARTMVVRERGDRTQIGVLEDGVLVEHFVTSSGSGSIVGNVYLGRVQNVLPSMEAAFIDIGRGRNAVLYAGEVDWDAAGLEGKSRKIEQALSSGDSVLVQVTKDPVGHKGARLTTQISLPGRFLVYVPGGGATGISRKLPDNERKRLKDILKRVVPEDAGVIIRTASEGISEEELGRDVTRLQAQWKVIKEKSESTSTKAPTLLYEEPDLLVKVVRDLFTEDFAQLVVQGDEAWDVIDGYVRHVAPDLQDRLKKHVGNNDAFVEYRIDEQLMKALDRKVWLPSGGYLIIDRTEAMTVIDVNTGKFTGSGGNLEETVTRNNLESAEEIVRQLRLRDIGGIIVIDFIDMVLESNRDLVLRRLTECLGRDRTRHQVAEVTSLGLVQMTRKRVGTGLLEAFSQTCEHCRGRGVVVSTEPVHSHGGGNGGGQQQQAQGGGRKSRRNKGGGDQAVETTEVVEASVEAPEAPAEPEVVIEPGEPEDTSEDVVAADQEHEGHGRRRRRRRGRDKEPQAVVDAVVVEEQAVNGHVPHEVAEDPAPVEVDPVVVAEPEPVVIEETAEELVEPVSPEPAAEQPVVTGRIGAQQPAVTGRIGAQQPAVTGRIGAQLPAPVAEPEQEPVQAAESVTAPAPVTAPEPVAEAPAAVVEAPAARPRRRAAKRAAGAPAATEAPAPVVVEVPKQPEVQMPAPVVTTTRRRRAVSRPAGPPVQED